MKLNISVFLASFGLACRNAEARTLTTTFNGMHEGEVSQEEAYEGDYFTQVEGIEILNPNLEGTAINDFDLPLAGMAAIDIDGDGVTDIVACNTKNDGVKGFGAVTVLTGSLTGDRGVSFTDTTANTGDLSDANCNSVAAGDFNNDGHMDLFLGDALTGCSVAINDGNGVFTRTALPGCPLPVALAPEDVVLTGTLGVGDVDGDGNLDVFITSLPIGIFIVPPPTGFTVLFLGDGSGGFTFIDFQDHFGVRTDRSCGVAITDIDNDGDQDILLEGCCCGGTGGPLVLFRNLRVEQGGTLGFEDASSEFFATDPVANVGATSERIVDADGHLIGTWMGYAIGDVNADGLLDMYFGNVGSNVAALGLPNSDHMISLQGEDGVYDDSWVPVGLPGEMYWNFGAQFIDVLNSGDGDDLVTAGRPNNPTLLAGNNPGTLIRNNGGVYGDVVQQFGHISGTDAIVADFNQDGFQDLAFAEVFGGETPGVQVWLNTAGPKSGNHFIVVTLEDTSGTFDRHATGSKIVLNRRDGKKLARQHGTSNGAWSSGLPQSFFGLGDISRGDFFADLEVQWPNGEVLTYNLQPGCLDSFVEINYTEQVRQCMPYSTGSIGSSR